MIPKAKKKMKMKMKMSKWTGIGKTGNQMIKKQTNRLTAHSKPCCLFDIENGNKQALAFPQRDATRFINARHRPSAFVLIYNHNHVLIPASNPDAI